METRGLAKENNSLMVQAHRAIIHAIILFNLLLNDEEMDLEGSLKLPNSKNVTRVSP